MVLLGVLIICIFIIHLVCFGSFSLNIYISFKDGWRPRRTIIFCSWAAEEYGLVGSNEWIEQFSTHLQQRAVAYLNVDMVFESKCFVTLE